MYNLSGTTKGSYLIDPTSQIEGGYTYKKGFYDTDETQDVVSHTFFASYKKAFGDDPIMVSLNTSHINNIEVNQGRTDVASSGYSYGVDISKAFKNGFKTSIGYTASTTDYKDIDVLFNTKRADTRDQYEFGLGYEIQSNFVINATITYAKNNSNHDPFDYDKLTALLTAMYTF